MFTFAALAPRAGTASRPPKMLCDDACIAQGSQRASVPTPRAAAVSAPEKQFFGTSVRTAYALQRTRLGFPPRAAAAHASPAPPAATNKSDAKGGKRAASQAANSSSGGGAPSEKTVTAFVYRLSDACSAGPSKEQAKRFGLVLAEAREQSIDPSALIARTMGLLKGGNKARAMRVLAARAAEVEEPLTTAAYQQLVEGAVLGKDSKSAAHWLEELAFRGGLVPRIPTVNAVVDLMMRRGEAAAAAGLLERLWDKGLKRDPSTFETMATACVARGWPEEALACAREMIAASAALEARNPRRAPVRANKVLRLLVGAGARKEAAALFADMRAPSCHFKPDAATYDAMARDAVAAREFGTAVGHAAQARAEGIDFGAFRLNAIVKELIAGGDLEGAGALVSAMAAWPEVGTTGVTWIQYINALVVAGKLEEAAEAFAKARPKLLAPSDAAELASLYNIAVKGAAAGRMFNRVRGLVEEMRGDGVRPDAATYGLWMDALVAEGRLSEAISVFDEARRALPEGTPMSGIWNIVLKGFLALGQVDDGRRWLATMRAEGVAPTCGRSRRWRRRWRRRGASPRPASSSTSAAPPPLPRPAPSRPTPPRPRAQEAAAAGAADRRLYASFLTVRPPRPPRPMSSIAKTIPCNKPTRACIPLAVLVPSIAR
eukprot:tig00000737_g3804.t1